MKYTILLMITIHTLVLNGQQPRFVLPLIKDEDARPLFSPDNKYAAVDGLNCLFVYDLEKKQMVYAIEGDLESPQFVEQGKRISYIKNKKVFLLELSRGKEDSLSIPGADFSGKCQVSPHAKYLGIRRFIMNDTLRIWSLSTKKIVLRIPLVSYPDLVFTDDDKYAVVRFPQKCIKYDLKTGDSVGVVHFRNFVSSTLGPDGASMVDTNDDTLRLWSLVNPGKLLVKEAGRVDYVRYSDDGKLIFARFPKAQYKVFDNAGNLVNEFKQIYYAISISSDGKTIAEPTKNGYRFYETTTGKLLDSMEYQYAFHYDVDLVMSPGGKYRFIGGGSSYIFQKDKPEIRWLENSDNIQYARLSPWGKLMVSCGESWLKLWSLEESKQVGSYYSKRAGYDIEFDETGETLMLWDGKSLDILDVRKLNHLYSKQLDEGMKIRMAFYNKVTGAIGTIHGNTNPHIVIWGDSLRKKIGSIDLKYTNKLPKIKFDINGTQILVVYPDSMLVYDVKTKKKVIRIDRNSTDNPFADGYISPDNKYVISIPSQQNLGIVWNIETGKRIHQVLGPMPIFTHDSKWIVTGETFYDIKDGAPAGEKHMGLSSPMYWRRTGVAAEVPDSNNLNRMITVGTNEYNGFKPLYKIIFFGHDQWLMFDEKGNFDGPDEACNLLMLARGSQILDPKYAKEKRVPGLSLNLADNFKPARWPRYNRID